VYPAARDQGISRSKTGGRNTVTPSPIPCAAGGPRSGVFGRAVIAGNARRLAKPGMAAVGFGRADRSGIPGKRGVLGDRPLQHALGGPRSHPLGGAETAGPAGNARRCFFRTDSQENNEKIAGSTSENERSFVISTEPDRDDD